MKNILAIQQKLQTLDKKLYIVGGFCRDRILGIENEWDVDLVTDATPEEMKQVLKVVGEVGKKYGTCIVSEAWEIFELTTFRKDIGSINYRKPVEVVFTDSLTEDSARRDFSCNAIYFDPATEEYIDPSWWIQDMKNWIIRFVWNIEERIQEDALRILRFVRFKNKYKLKVADEKYLEILSQNIHLLQNLPTERIRQELDKMLLHNSNAQSLDDLKRIWFLKLFLPQLDCLSDFPWNKHHLEWDVWTHTKMCINEMNTILEREKIEWGRKLLLLWAILLHDIGKAPTYSVGTDSESHYYNHEQVWADMFHNELASQFLFSSYIQKRTYWIIAQHLRLFHLPSMKKLKARKLMMHDFFPDLLIVAEADTKWRLPRKTETFEQIVEMYADFQELLKTKVFLTGEDIMMKYPELEGRAIWEKLWVLNDEILLRD